MYIFVIIPSGINEIIQKIRIIAKLSQFRGKTLLGSITMIFKQSLSLNLLFVFITNVVRYQTEILAIIQYNHVKI